MKIRSPLFSAILLAALAGNALAQTAPIAAPPVPPVPSVAVSASKSWLGARGVLSVDDLAALLGEEFSPARRVQLQTALAARNAALEEANARLATQLNQILGQGETQITARIAAKSALDVEDERMERLKRLQPSRYRELMRRKKAGGEK